MTTSQDALLRIPDLVRQKAVSYRTRLAEYLTGETSEADFRSYCAGMGIYEQHEKQTFMLRVRIGAGLAVPEQLRRIAALSRDCGSGVNHVTTRQDIQIHGLRIEDTADIVDGLLEVGLSSCGGGGNTVRNVSACPRSGVCPNAEFDAAPHAIATAEYLMADAGAYTLPRKYKIVFSACANDCALASVADLGFFAHKANGIEGFSVYAAGGLGANPAVAILLEEFIPAGEVFAVAEAIKQLFDKHGDRQNRNKARLRYVVARLGAAKFIELYQAQREALKSTGLPRPTAEIRDIESIFSVSAGEGTVATSRHIMPEVTPGRFTVRAELQGGHITSQALEEIADVAASYGQGLIRTTQKQNLLISGVAGEDVSKVTDRLQAAGLTDNRGGPDITSCIGVTTCRRGICRSRELAEALRNTLANCPPDDTAIRISGCPNSCANHHIAQIALQGRIKRVGDKRVPHYDVLTGGAVGEGRAKLARKIGTVPEQQIPNLLLEAAADGKIDVQALEQLVSRCGQADAS